MVFCQKNILEHSMSFHGDYIKRCILTHRVSQILLLTRLISEIKYLAANRLFLHFWSFLLFVQETSKLGTFTYSIALLAQEHCLLETSAMVGTSVCFRTKICGFSEHNLKKFNL
jgi:hypothetical protein